MTISLTPTLLRIPFQGISHVSDIEAEDVLDIINVLVPEIEKVLELVREKKNVAEIFDIGLPIIRSIAFTAGRFFMWATHVNVKNPTISLIRSEIKCMHDHAMALANTMEKLAPVRSSSFVKYVSLELISRCSPSTRKMLRESGLELTPNFKRQLSSIRHDNVRLGRAISWIGHLIPHFSSYFIFPFVQL